jgi:hypothetical protein
MVHLRSRKLIQHVHGGRKQDTLIRLTRFPAKHFCQKRFAYARISNQNQIRALA